MKFQQRLTPRTWKQLEGELTKETRREIRPDRTLLNSRRLLPPRTRSVSALFNDEDLAAPESDLEEDEFDLDREDDDEDEDDDDLEDDEFDVEGTTLDELDDLEMTAAECVAQRPVCCIATSADITRLTGLSTCPPVAKRR